MPALTTGELAKQGDVNLESIRFYERERLLPKAPRTASGYRMFSADDVRRVRFIKRAQELGFSLKEIKELLSLRDHPNTACHEVRSQAEAKITDVSEKIRHLRAIKRELTRLSDACAGVHRPHSCPILTRLEGVDGKGATKGTRR